MNKLSDVLTPEQRIAELQEQLTEARAEIDDLNEGIRAALNTLPGQKMPDPDDSLQRLVNLAIGILKDTLTAPAQQRKPIAEISTVTLSGTEEIEVVIGSEPKPDAEREAERRVIDAALHWRNMLRTMADESSEHGAMTALGMAIDNLSAHQQGSEHEG